MVSMQFNDILLTDEALRQQKAKIYSPGQPLGQVASPLQSTGNSLTKYRERKL